MADAINDAEAEVQAAQAEFDKAADKYEAAKAVRDAAQEKLDAAIEARNGPEHPHQDQIERMAYIKRQAEVRAGRYRKAADLTEKLGAHADELRPQAPLDAAMARKTKRGTARPKIEKVSS